MCEIKYYEMIARLQDILKELHPDFVHSVFVYGSACRLEIIPGISDLDIMVVLANDVLNVTQIGELNFINNELHREYKIHCNFRIRNNTDLEKKTSGIVDCGLSSICNDLRDSIYLYGESLDNEFLSCLKNAKPNEAAKNLHIRFSEIRHQLRSLVSIGKYNDTAKRSDGAANMAYELGDILCDFAENICFFHGEEFSTVRQGLSKSAALSRCRLFSDAFDIKQNKKDIDAFAVIAELDALLNRYLSQNSAAFPDLLRDLRLADEVVTDAEMFAKKMEVKNGGALLFSFDLAKIVSGRNLTFKYLSNHTITRYHCHF